MPTARHRSELPAILGGIALVAGVYGPAVNVDVYGAVSFHDAARSQAVIVLLCAIASLLVVFLRRHAWLIATAPVAWIAVLWPVLEPHLVSEESNPLTELKALVVDPVVDEVASALSDAALEVSDISWGGFALLAGCILLTVAAVRSRRAA
jgi:hypothetical protein